MKTPAKFYLVLGLAFLGVLFWLGIVWFNFTQTPLIASAQSPINFVFTPGSSAKTLALQLQQLKLISNPKRFAILARLSGVADDLKAGEYQITSGTTPHMLLNKMQRGDVIKHEFKIIEGWSFYQVISALAANNFILHTLNGLDSSAIMSKIGHPGEMPEGHFAPDTYVFSGQIKDSDLLLWAYDLMNKRVAALWQTRAPNLVYHCPYEALIVASIIEKETAVDQERSIIAGVVSRRLTSKMLLQLDPTVIYGIGKNFSGKLTAVDLATDSLYNTYTRKGLPISPISMPGIASIMAALHPAAGTVIYYVAKGDGTHVFSNTLAEQNLAIKKYILHKK